MDKNVWLRNLLLIFLLVGLSLPAVAERPGPRPDRAKAVKKIIDELELTDSQKGLFKEQREEMKQEAASHRDKVKKLADALKTEMAKNEPDKVLIHDTIRQINELNAQMQIKRADSLLKLREQLTPEQRDKFKNMLERQSGMNRQPGPWSDLSIYDILVG